MRNRSLVCIVALIGVTGIGIHSFADDAKPGDLETRVRALEKRIDELSQKLEQVEIGLQRYRMPDRSRPPGPEAWEQIRNNMMEPDVIAILGDPRQKHIVARRTTLDYGSQRVTLQDGLVVGRKPPVGDNNRQLLTTTSPAALPWWMSGKNRVPD